MGLCSVIAILRAAQTAVYIARASLPSTRMLLTPYPRPLTTTPSPTKEYKEHIHKNILDFKSIGMGNNKIEEHVRRGKNTSKLV